MDENKFWLSLWALAALVVIAIAACVTGATVMTNYLVLKAADPIAAACSQSGTYGSPSCMIVSARSKP